MKYQVQCLARGMFATNVGSFIHLGIIWCILYLFYNVHINTKGDISDQ